MRFHRFDIRSSSTRTFVMLPIVAAAEAALRRIRPRPGYVPLLAWGYLQYRWCGTYRSRRGGGGPGMSVPPERLVTTGPYAVARNPMYLGHLVFAVGVAAVTRSRAATLTAAILPLRFGPQVRRDEQRLAELFGAEYAAYSARVARWGPRPASIASAFSAAGRGRPAGRRDRGKVTLARRPGAAVAYEDHLIVQVPRGVYGARDADVRGPHQ